MTREEYQIFLFGIKNNLIKFGCDKPGGRPLSQARVAELGRFKGAICQVRRKKDGKILNYKDNRKGVAAKAEKAIREKKRKETSGKKGKAKTQPRKPEKKQEVKPGIPTQVKAGQIKVDPKRFQYKVLGQTTATGEAGSLSGVPVYNPMFGGLIQVWKDPQDGNTYVINGHNRLALAKRSGVDSVNAIYIDAKDAKEARAVGALTNISEGRGNEIDAAKFLKDSNMDVMDLHKMGIPLKEAVADKGTKLAKLPSDIFQKVIDGDISSQRGSIIGGSGLDEHKQREVLKLIEKKDTGRNPISNSTIQNLVDMARLSEQKASFEDDLFGGEEKVQDNLFNRSKLQSMIQRRLAKDSRIFGTVTRKGAAGKLEEAGSKIDVETAKNKALDSRKVGIIFEDNKNLKGKVSDLINKAANDYENAKGSKKKKIEDSLFDEVSEAIRNLPEWKFQQAKPLNLMKFGM